MRLIKLIRLDVVCFVFHSGFPLKVRHQRNVLLVWNMTRMRRAIIFILRHGTTLMSHGGHMHIKLQQWGVIPLDIYMYPVKNRVIPPPVCIFFLLFFSDWANLIVMERLHDVILIGLAFNPIYLRSVGEKKHLSSHTFKCLNALNAFQIKHGKRLVLNAVWLIKLRDQLASIDLPFDGKAFCDIRLGALNTQLPPCNTKTTTQILASHCRKAEKLVKEIVIFSPPLSLEVRYYASLLAQVLIATHFPSGREESGNPVIEAFFFFFSFHKTAGSINFPMATEPCWGSAVIDGWHTGGQIQSPSMTKRS